MYCWKYMYFSVILTAIIAICMIGDFHLKSKQACKPCNDLCGSCSVPYLTHCDTCKYLEQGQQCVDHCQINYYPNYAGKQCRPCHEQCRGCTGPSSIECKKCMSYKVYLDEEMEDSTVEQKVSRYVLVVLNFLLCRLFDSWLSFSFKLYRYKYILMLMYISVQLYGTVSIQSTLSTTSRIIGVWNWNHLYKGGVRQSFF